MTRGFLGFTNRNISFMQNVTIVNVIDDLVVADNSVVIVYCGLLISNSIHNVIYIYELKQSNHGERYTHFFLVVNHIQRFFSPFMLYVDFQENVK